MLIAPCLLALGFKSCLPPTDLEMIANFSLHRAEFEQLVKIFKEDQSVGRVSWFLTLPSISSAPDSASGITLARWSRYVWLFQRTGASEGIEGNKDKTEIDIISYMFFPSLSGPVKGYAYRETPPSPLVGNLTLYAWGRRNFIAYRHIVDNWYLYSADF